MNWLASRDPLPHTSSLLKRLLILYSFSPHFPPLNLNFSITFVDEMASGDTRNAVYKLWGCSADVEHPHVETDEADTIPD